MQDWETEAKRIGTFCMRQSIPERTRTVISIRSIIMDVCIQYARAYGVCSCLFALQV